MLLTTRSTAEDFIGKAYTGKRTPAVGDEAYDITGGWRNVTVASVLSETPEATYIEPWVSLTLEGLPQKVRLWCNGTQHYYGMEYVGPDKTYGDYYKWSSFEIEDRPATDYYYTTTRKLNLGDPVYWSMEGGVDTHEPCAWVESFLEADHRVDYNKIRMTPEEAVTAGNYLRLSLVEDGNINNGKVDWDMTAEFGPNFDNSANSALVLQGHLQYSPDTALTVIGFPSDDPGFRDDSGYGTLVDEHMDGNCTMHGWYYYDETPEEFANFKYNISFASAAYYCYYENGMWHIGYRGPMD